MKFDLYIGDQPIPCEELKVSLYKDLLKSTYGDEPDLKRFVETICELFSTLTNKPISFFENLSIVELMSCVLQLRMLSIGDRTNVSLNIDETKRSLELRLDWVNEDLLTFDKEVVKRTLMASSVAVEIESPSVKRLLEKSDEDYLYFIKKVKVGNKEVFLETNKDAKDITEKLPIKVVLLIIEHFEELVKNLKHLNFLKRYQITDHSLNFIPSIESLLWFTKLIFNENLQSLYDNIFYLSKLSNIPPSYTENCSIGDYFVYVGILRTSIAQQKGNEQEPTMLSEEAVSDFSNE